MAEWFKAAVLKTVDSEGLRGFESLFLRQDFGSDSFSLKHLRLDSIFFFADTSLNVTSLFSAAYS